MTGANNFVSFYYMLCLLSFYCSYLLVYMVLNVIYLNHLLNRRMGIVRHQVVIYNKLTLIKSISSSAI